MAGGAPAPALSPRLPALTVRSTERPLYLHLHATTSNEDAQLAKPNYAFAKRQREAAKKQKKEEKQKRKAEERDATAAGEAAPTPPAEPGQG